MIRFLLAFTLILPAFGAELSPFSSDECTYFPEGTHSQPKLWAECCVEHDLKYWIGGTKSEQVTSDLQLKDCVSQKSSEFYGELMYRGVVLGHLSPIKSETRWSWGFGKPYREFQALSKDDKDLALEIIEQADIDPDMKRRFIKQYLK